MFHSSPAHQSPTLPVSRPSTSPVSHPRMFLCFSLYCPVTADICTRYLCGCPLLKSANIPFHLFAYSSSFTALVWMRSDHTLITKVKDVRHELEPLCLHRVKMLYGSVQTVRTRRITVVSMDTRQQQDGLVGSQVKYFWLQGGADKLSTQDWVSAGGAGKSESLGGSRIKKKKNEKKWKTDPHRPLNN